MAIHVYVTMVQQRNTFVLGGISFPSKKAAQDFVSNYLRNARDGQPIREQDVDWFHDMIRTEGTSGMHPTFEQKTKDWTGEVRVRRDWGNLHFSLVQKDGHEIDISYRKCFSACLNTHGHNVTRAFRQAVQSQIDEFREQAFRYQTVLKCPETQTSLLNDANAHVDHHITPFRSLLRMFLSENKLKETDIAVKDSDDGLKKWLCDVDLLRRWRDYHAQHACLRMVSGHWNVRH